MITSMREKYNNKKTSSKADKKTTSSSCSPKRKMTPKHKRKELSISATKTVTKQYVKVIVSFD